MKSWINRNMFSPFQVYLTVYAETIIKIYKLLFMSVTESKYTSEFVFDFNELYETRLLCLYYTFYFTWIFN